MVSAMVTPLHHYELNAEPGSYRLTGEPARLVFGPAALVGYAVEQVIAHPPRPEPAYHIQGAHENLVMTGLEVVVAWSLVTAWLLRERQRGQLDP